MKKLLTIYFLLSLCALNNSIAQNKGYNLNNDLTTTKSVTVLDSIDLSIAVGVKITVTAGDTLIIQNSHLFACGNMWRGIIVDSGGTLIVFRSLIEDAQYAVEGKSGSTIQLNETTFNKDYDGIYVAPNAAGNSVAIMINYCKFSCDAYLKGGAPHPYRATFAGIEIHDLALLNLTGFNNTFDSLNFGIYSISSNINVRRAKFRYIDRYDLLSFQSSAAIYSSGTASKGSNVTFTGGQTPDFDHCFQGVQGIFSNLTITNARMTNMRTGIYANFCAFKALNIGSNNIQATYYGIRTWMNPGTVGYNIHDNTVTITGSNGRGVTAREPGGNNPNAIVIGNYVTMRSNIYSDGVDVESANSFRVTANGVQMDSTAAGAGHAFYFANNTSLNAQCNSANGNNRTLSDSTTQAMSTWDCTNYFYKCNNTDSTHEGIFFDGTNVGRLESNNISKHAYGLHVKRGGSMGAQNHEGNIWLGASYVKGAWHEDSLVASIQLIRYQNTTNIPSSILPSYWFVPVTGTDSICPTQPAPYCGGSNIVNPTGNDSLTATDLLIVQDSIHSTLFNEQTVWKMRRMLMQKLMIDSTLISLDTNVTNFYNEHVNDKIGLLSNIRLAMNKLSIIDTATVTTIQSNLDAIDNIITEIAYYDSVIFNDSTLTHEEILGLASDNEGRRSNVKMFADDNSTLYDSIQTSISSRASSILSSNDTLSSGNIYEQNEITVNSIYLMTIAQGQVDSLDYYESALHDIAVQCVKSGGPAVFFARSLYALINDTIIYNDDCNEVGARMAQQKIKEGTEVWLKAFPNPTRDVITVQFHASVNGKYSINVLDAISRVIITKEIDGVTGINEQVINLKGYSDGIYYLSLQANDYSRVIKLTLLK